MGTERMRRVDEAMREVLSAALSEGLKDPRVGFVTVTDVKTSPDLRHARVFVSVLGDAAARAATLDGLASAHGYLQGRIGRELRMKRTPRALTSLPAISSAMPAIRRWPFSSLAASGLPITPEAAMAPSVRQR